MNIITSLYGGKEYFIRPDTSINKDSNDYFCPETIESFAAVPCIWVKAVKPGKHVKARFANRYYNLVGYSVRFIANTPDNCTHAQWYLSNVINSTFTLSKGVSNEQVSEIIEKINSPLNILEGGVNNSYIIENNPIINSNDFTSIMGEVIENCSIYTFFKIGDYITYDLIPVENAPIVTPSKNGTINYGDIKFSII